MAVSDCRVATNDAGQELARHGSPAFPIAVYYDDLRSAAVPWHWHEELEFAVVTAGSGIVAIDSQKVKLEKGDGFFVNTGVLHAAWDAGNVEGCRFHSMVFHARLVGGEPYSVFWEKYLTPLLRGVKFQPLFPSEAWQKEALDSIEQAWRLCERETSGYEFGVRGQLSRLVLLLTTHLPAPRKTSPLERRSAERMKTMLLFIHEHFMDPLDTEKIAGSASISESECLRCFHKVIGTTPIQYLRQYRLRKAEELLVAGDVKIAEIAGRCGFQDLSYFSKIFREKNAVTPSEYRKRASS